MVSRRRRGTAPAEEPRRTWRLGQYTRTPGTRAGIIVDDVVYPLEGEPPTATSRGWGRLPGR